MNNRGCVKSVQRIFKENFYLGSGAIVDGYESSLSISISPINLSKSILLVNNCIFRPMPYAQQSYEDCVRCILQASSILLISHTSDFISNIIDIFEAQVIEFY